MGHVTLVGDAADTDVDPDAVPGTDPAGRDGDDATDIDTLLERARELRDGLSFR
jgi:hypothetical protein